MYHKLILMRHGHASFEASSDYQRPLTEAGREAVRHTAEHLKPLLSAADVSILSSDALRTRHSAEVLAKHCQIPADNIHTDCELYGATPGLWLKKVPALLRQTGSNILLCVGHNPAMGQLLAILTGNNRHMRTASAAVVDTRWQGDEVVLPAKLVDYFDPNET